MYLTYGLVISNEESQETVIVIGDGDTYEKAFDVILKKTKRILKKQGSDWRVIKLESI